MDIAKLLLGLAAAYLIGSFPTGVIVGKLFFRKDPRDDGSGASGATNIFRQFGPVAGIAVTLVEVAKGALAAAVSSAMSGTYQAGVRAAEAFGGKVRYFASKTITAGQGALVDFAARLVESGASADEVLSALEARGKKIELFVAIKDLRSLIRSPDPRFRYGSPPRLDRPYAPACLLAAPAAPFIAPRSMSSTFPTS